MSVTVHIPKKEKSRFSLYARGLILNKITDPDNGTLIEFEGVTILFYSYPRHRRAYIVQNTIKSKCLDLAKLPNVAKPVHVIYEARGRRFDILRKIFFHLENIDGRNVYLYSLLFWQYIGCLLDYNIIVKKHKIKDCEYKYKYLYKANKINLISLCNHFKNIP